MHRVVGQGGTIRLEGLFRDGSGTLVDPVNPRLDILDPSDVEIVTDAIPVKDEVGRYHYDHAVAADAALGIWAVHWTGTINGGPVQGDDLFEVKDAGDVEFDGLTSLATLEEFEARIPGGIAATDEARAQAALDDASAIIRAEAGKTWATETVPAIIKTVCMSAARRAFVNPDMVRQESIDGYSASFAFASPDVYLTKAEKALVRKNAGRSGVWALPLTRGDEMSTVYVDVEGQDEPMPVLPSEWA